MRCNFKHNFVNTFSRYYPSWLCRPLLLKNPVFVGQSPCHSKRPQLCKYQWEKDSPTESGFTNDSGMLISISFISCHLSFPVSFLKNSKPGSQNRYSKGCYFWRPDLVGSLIDLFIVETGKSQPWNPMPSILRNWLRKAVRATIFWPFFRSNWN